MAVMIDGQLQYIGRTIQVRHKAEHEEVLVANEDGTTKLIRVLDGPVPTEDATPEILKMIAERHEAAAKAREDRAWESFQRCDTDGFLSQWASQEGARLERLLAHLAENRYMSTFWGLYEGDRRVKAKEINTKFGTCWLLHEDEQDLISKRGKPFLPTGGKSRVLKGLGLQEREETAPAYACHGQHGPIRYRTGDKWGSDAVLNQEEAA